MSKRTTRALMVVLSAAAFQFALFSQTVLSAYLEDLTRYFGATATFIANAVSGVDKVDPAKIPKVDCSKVRDELNRISLEISELRARQERLLFDLSDYVDEVRAGKLTGKSREDKWQSILSRVRSVSIIVGKTPDVVENSRWLQVTLGAEDLLKLRGVLIGRRDLLGEIQSLPAPSTKDEIDELDRMNTFYRQLIRSLGELNAALTRATERLRLE